MNKKVGIGAAIITAAAVAVSLFSTGTPTLYVSKAGLDSNACTLEAPCLTIQKAVNIAEPGDIVGVMAGTYNESVLISTTGLEDENIVLTNYQDDEVIINGGSNPAIRLSNQMPRWWIFEGLKLYSTNSFTIQYQGWDCNGACGGIDHNTFSNNYISGAVQIYGAYNLFEGNEVDGTLNNGNGGNGVQDMYDVSHHNIFRNNTVHNFSNRGFWSMHRTHDNLWEGNTIYNIPGLYGINNDG